VIYLVRRHRLGPLGALLLGSFLVLAVAAARPDALTPADLIRPDELTKALSLPEKDRPLILHVGPQALFRTGRIPDARFAGPGSTARGRATLQRALLGVPPSRPIVLYCGCCPWVNCPNVKPAFETARSSGYSNVKVLYIAQDMKRDWVSQGRPWDLP